MARALLKDRQKLNVGEAMTVNTHEFLVFVAIVTSAIVLQVRQHGIGESLAAAHAQLTHEGLCTPAASALRNGPLRASCEPANDVRGTSAQPGVRVQLWV
jgi:hypothetical protein